MQMASSFPLKNTDKLWISEENTDKYRHFPNQKNTDILIKRTDKY